VLRLDSYAIVLVSTYKSSYNKKKNEGLTKGNQVVQNQELGLNCWFSYAVSLMEKSSDMPMAKKNLDLINQYNQYKTSTCITHTEPANKGVLLGVAVMPNA
jgi:hypothetical protein